MQFFAKRTPIGKPRIHQGLELGTVIVRLEVRHFMDDDVIIKVGRHKRELQVVDDDALLPMAHPPHRLHLTVVNRDISFAKLRRPLLMVDGDDFFEALDRLFWED